MTFWHTSGNCWGRKVESWARISLLLILLLAASLRFYRLDAQSLWADEGNSVRLAERSLSLITQGAAHDIHPPLYYYLLHFWMRAFGRSEVAVRSLSALAGTALVWLTYLLGRQLFDQATGLAAAFLAALSPFQVYYSQEARMYILAALLGALSVYFFGKLVNWELVDWESGNRGPLAPASQPPIYQSTNHQFTNHQSTNLPLFILFTTLGLYTHYSFPIVMAAENLVYGLWLALSWRWRFWARLARWATLQLAVVALYLPWLPIAYRQLRGWPPISEPLSASFIFGEALRLYSLGPTAERGGLAPWLMAGFAILFLAGFLPSITNLRVPNSRITNLRIFLLLLYSLLPALTIYGLSLLKPTYRPKFFLVGSPAFYLLLARGVLFFRQRSIASKLSASYPLSLALRCLLPAFCLVFIATASAHSLHNYYFDPRYARDDYRGIAEYISALGREGDAVILNAPNQWEVFTYYYHGGLPLYPLPRSRPLDEAQTAEELEAIAARHNRLFAVLWALPESDPNRFVERWLSEHAYKASDEWYGNVRLAIYALPTGTEPPTRPQTDLQVKLGDKIALLGYSLAADRIEAGDILRLTLFWQALGKPGERYKVFVHVLDEANHIVGQCDSEPGAGMRITTLWQPGQTVVDNYGVLIWPGTPPGRHRLEIGMYSLATGQRLSVGGGEGDRILLGPIEVLRPAEPPPPAALKMQHREGVEVEGLALLGYDLHKLGYSHRPEEPLHPGDILHLNLYWRAERAPEDDWRLTLRLVDGEGRAWATQEAPLAGVDYPATSWQAGEVVRAQFDLFIPSDAPAGRYRVEGELVPTSGGPARPFWASRWFAVRGK